MTREAKPDVRLWQPGLSYESAQAGSWEKEREVLDLLDWPRQVLSSEQFVEFVEKMNALLGGAPACVVDEVKGLVVDFKCATDQNKNKYTSLEFRPKELLNEWKQDRCKHWEGLTQPLVVERISTNPGSRWPVIETELHLPPNANFQLVYESFLTGEERVFDGVYIIRHKFESTGATNILNSSRRAFFIYAQSRESSGELKSLLGSMARAWGINAGKDWYVSYRFEQSQEAIVPHLQLCLRGQGE